MADHPASRIPPLALDAPAITTDVGVFRPERAVVYNWPALVLHHYASCQPAAAFPLSAAAMAGLEKTGRRLQYLLVRAKALQSFVPLWWEEPEGIGFALVGDINLHAAAESMRRHLIQAEALERHTLNGIEVLEFWRC